MKPTPWDSSPHYDYYKRILNFYKYFNQIAFYGKNQSKLANKAYKTRFKWSKHYLVKIQIHNVKIVEQDMLQGVPFGFDIMYLALADRNMQVRFGLKVVWES